MDPKLLGKALARSSSTPRHDVPAARVVFCYDADESRSRTSRQAICGGTAAVSTCSNARPTSLHRPGLVITDGWCDVQDPARYAFRWGASAVRARGPVFRCPDGDACDEPGIRGREVSWRVGRRVRPMPVRWLSHDEAADLGRVAAREMIKSPVAAGGKPPRVKEKARTGGCCCGSSVCRPAGRPAQLVDKTAFSPYGCASSAPSPDRRSTTTPAARGQRGTLIRCSAILPRRRAVAFPGRRFGVDRARPAAVADRRADSGSQEARAGTAKPDAGGLRSTTRAQVGGTSWPDVRRVAEIAERAADREVIGPFRPFVGPRCGMPDAMFADPRLPGSTTPSTHPATI